MAELKTKKTDASVSDFLATIEDGAKRADCEQLRAIMSDLTGDEPAMWGAGLVGFGHYHFTYASGREGDWFRVGFAPRARNITLYIMSGFDAYDGIMARLGKFKTGKSCLYVKQLSDVDEAVLRELISASLDYLKQTYG